MIRLITATPGSGKTCLVVEWLIREVERGFYKEFYTNIEGLRICGVRPLPPDCDWRALNPNKDPKEPPKLVIIDECQYIDAFMKENRSVHNKIGKDLSTHRHYGIDIWFITQSVKLLNDYVLENVGEHVHLYRPRKRKSVTVYWWSYVQKSLTKSAFKDADDMQVWRLNPAMFDYYKSTSQVTDNKARYSKKVINSLITVVLIFIIISYFVSKGLDFYVNASVSDIANTDKAVNAVLSNQSQDDLNLVNDQDELKNTEKNEDLSVSDDLFVEKRSNDDMTNANTKNEPLPVHIPSYVPPSSTLLFDPYLPAPSVTSSVAIPFDNKPAMMFYNNDTSECIAKNKQQQNIDLDAKNCVDYLQTVGSP
ncbi:Zonular occludens toxin (Zot) [Moraxella cuniculi DSM 21768]|uniref:Zonular occludens toxin (Zot) n=1 Tax=Moraxella cuniculi DSM 21768 TaxID=1122245 RepID=A0A1N7G8I7_9GAMM|nr:zonular occludens toxin domain-containing protein [Moraxella cuniculi]OOS02665.1 hypothetical protein B0189_10020 [Moraxella cuniculi]SIS08736.1 Zonular occludens toxin (Zot) [Moraxella cuniculi DSM 21768]SIS08822.1 Zonular occludens toxin (Zot) [Moraxella cuniculi DSM 21768]